MLDQNFTGKSFLRLTSVNDIIRFKLGKKREEYLEKLERVAKKILEEGCDFSDLSFYIKNEKKYSNRILLKVYIAYGALTKY